MISTDKLDIKGFSTAKTRVNTDIFKPVDVSNLKKKYGVENSDVIMYVGRIAKGKGVDKLIHILNLVIKENIES